MMMAEESRSGGSRDQFPVGMRVLAVDDDPTCLKLLETLLRRCRYHVTTTNQAIKALKMLRENKDKFDLVISDVHMPDMDGFKLLELVGLEMDLPVIMLSGNGETKTVMKGITHGAVDYLLKPIRIEALRNIWQHVIRKKNVDRRDNNNLDNGEEFEKPLNVNSDVGQSAGSNGSTEYNGNLNRKRKDQIEEDEDGCEENESEDPSAQKKPRVVWSVELHRKFVAAVNRLGVDKAVPKRILDLMNVERLTRENVASHLQKYRLYLKRLSAVASQQANMVAALGGRDLSYLPYSVDGFGNFHALTASGQSSALSSYQPNGVLNLASPTASGLQGLARSGVVHFGPTHDTTSPPVNDFHKLQHINLPGNQHANLLQGMHMPWELEKLQQQTRMLPTNQLASSLSRSDAATGSSMNSFINVTDNPLLLQAHQQHIRSTGLTNNSSLTTKSMSADPFERDAGVPSFSPDLGRCSETWQGVAPLSVCTTKTLPTTIPSTRDDVALRMMEAYASPLASQINSNSLSISPNCVAAAPQHDPAVGRAGQCLASSVGRNMMLPTSTGEEQFLNFRNRGNSRQKLKELRTDHASGHSLILGSSLNHPLSNQPLLDSISENQRLNGGLYNQNMDTSMMGQTNFSAPLFTQSFKIDKSTSDGQQMYMDQHSFETPKLTGGLSSNGCNFDDLMNAMIKTEQDDVTFMSSNIAYDDDMGHDMFPLGTCM